VGCESESGRHLHRAPSPARSYRVSVQAQGFRAVSRAGVQLEVAQTAALDFTLDVGAASESITVTDSAPLLDSGSNAIGGLVTSEKVEDLPLLGRNSNALVMLVPGIRATRQTTVNPVLESHYQFFSINGSRPNQNQFMLDGGNNTNLTFNGPEYSPQVEEVQEFRIQTSNFSAEYANSGGGVINVVEERHERHGPTPLPRLRYVRVLLQRAVHFRQRSAVDAKPAEPRGCQFRHVAVQEHQHQ